MTINVKNDVEQFKAELDNYISGREANVAFLRAYIGQVLTDIRENVYSAVDKAVDKLKAAYAWTVELCKKIWAYIQQFFAWVKGSFQSLKDRSKSAVPASAAVITVEAQEVQ